MSEDIYHWDDWRWEGAPGSEGVEAGEAAQHPPDSKMAPNRMIQIKDINSAKLRKINKYRNITSGQ